MYTYVGSVISWAMCTHMSSSWCHVIDATGERLLVMLLNKFVLVLFHSHLGVW